MWCHVGGVLRRSALTSPPLPNTSRRGPRCGPRMDGNEFYSGGLPGDPPYTRGVSHEEAEPTSPLAGRSRLRTIAPIAVFDVIGPLVAYYSLRAAGLSTVSALVLSGVLPAVGIALKVARHRSVDAIGVLVLAG